MSMTDTSELTPSQELSRVSAPLERRRLGDMAVDRFAGLTFAEYRECVEFAKLMAQAHHSVPAYLKQNAGDCLAIVTQALRWHLEPYWVAQHSYIAKAESLIAYDAAVHAAIVLSSGLLKERPRYSYDGEGENRTCTVTATFKGERTPLEYTTPPLAKARPPKNQDGVVKGSPLWMKDPDQQLGYYAIRNWGRRHCPEVLGGVYDREEFEETTQDETDVIPPSPKLMERLPGKMEGAGFQTDVVDNGLAKAAAEVQEAKQEQKADRKARAKAAEASPAPEATPGTPTAQEAPTASPEPPNRGADVTEALAAGATVTVQGGGGGGGSGGGGELRPETADQYMAYAAIWIERGTDPKALEARWDGEKDMRADLKVSLGVRKRLEGMLRARVNTLRETPKKRK